MKRRILIIITLLTVIFVPCFAQDESYKVECHAHFTFEDSIPSMNFDEFLLQNVVWIDNEVDIQTSLIIEFDVVGNGEIDNIQINDKCKCCDFCVAAVEKAVWKSAPYWVLKSSALGNKERMRFKFKWALR